jgi:GTPase SAR1 family protein
MESVKYTVIGTPRCGKTSLIHRYLYSEWLQEERHTTAELYSLPISRVCVVGIWDTGTWPWRTVDVLTCRSITKKLRL